LGQPKDCVPTFHEFNLRVSQTLSDSPNSFHLIPQTRFNFRAKGYAKDPVMIP
jgi:hypothetical protein